MMKILDINIVTKDSSIEEIEKQTTENSAIQIVEQLFSDKPNNDLQENQVVKKTGCELALNIYQGFRYSIDKYINDNPIEDEDFESCITNEDEDFLFHLNRIQASRGFADIELTENDLTEISSFKPFKVEDYE